LRELLYCNVRRRFGERRTAYACGLLRPGSPSVYDVLPVPSADALATRDITDVPSGSDSGLE
jgi:hypothetical protein